MAIAGAVYLALLAAPLVLLGVPTKPATKWIALAMVALFFVGGLAQATAPGADIPPCHMMLPYVLWAAVAYRDWFHPRRRTVPPGSCQSCGYNLTGNTSGTCPECGTPVPQAG
jgi:hypothetical protein